MSTVVERERKARAEDEAAQVEKLAKRLTFFYKGITSRDLHLRLYPEDPRAYGITTTNRRLGELADAGRAHQVDGRWFAGAAKVEAPAPDPEQTPPLSIPELRGTNQMPVKNESATETPKMTASVTVPDSSAQEPATLAQQLAAAVRADPGRSPGWYAERLGWSKGQLKSHAPRAKAAGLIRVQGNTTHAVYFPVADVPSIPERGGPQADADVGNPSPSSAVPDPNEPTPSRHSGPGAADPLSTPPSSEATTSSSSSAGADEGGVELEGPAACGCLDADRRQCRRAYDRLTGLRATRDCPCTCHDNADTDTDTDTDDESAGATACCAVCDLTDKEALLISISESTGDWQHICNECAKHLGRVAGLIDPPAVKVEQVSLDGLEQARLAFGRLVDDSLRRVVERLDIIDARLDAAAPLGTLTVHEAGTFRERTDYGDAFVLLVGGRDDVRAVAPHLYRRIALHAVSPTTASRPVEAREGLDGASEGVRP
jgi:hypothetical protein